jgi:hypothetical protein
MPANFGDIAAFHHEQANRHYALAQAARDRGSLAEAEYQAGLAARWEEAAQEQKIGMRQQPSHPRAKQRPNSPAPVPIAIVILLAVMRGIKRIATAIRHPMVKRSAPFNTLSLR